MEDTIFKKMRLKEGTTGIYLYAPTEYISMAEEQKIIDFSKKEKYQYVHLFIESKKDYLDRINEVLSFVIESGAIWISYPKADRKNKYDINRDILFSMTPEQGIIACSSVALDDKWAAMRFKST